LQGALFEALAGAITRYDGFVEKFVGDAVLAVFGAPVAHEKDPARAPPVPRRQAPSAAISGTSQVRSEVGRRGNVPASLTVFG